jgi:hypothetical protein
MRFHRIGVDRVRQPERSREGAVGTFADVAAVPVFLAFDLLLGADRDHVAID